MAGLYLFLLLAILTWMFLKVLVKPSLVFEYPHFIASVFLVFIVPQAFSLLQFPGSVSKDAVTDVMLMCCLCMLASIVGYSLSPSLKILRRLAVEVDPGRIFHVGLAFIACSYFFTYLLATTEQQFTEASGLTGRATVYLFFAGLVFPGFAICLLLFLQQPTLFRLLATLVGGIIPVLHVVGARREPAVMLGLTVVLGLYYARRKVPSRLLIFGSLIFVMLAIPATGTYRGMVLYRGEIGALKQLDLWDNFRDYFSRESVLELRNGAAVIESTQRFSRYDYGAGYWNQIVFRFVPAQFVGMERKNALMIGTTVEKMNMDRTENGYEISTGSTLTGMGDSFKHFGWFGCLFFLVLALFFRSLWQASLQPNALFAQLLYILVCTSGMRALTHQTTDFLPGLIYQVTFLSLGILYAGKRKADVTPRRPGSVKPLRQR
ncbi:MAG: hypothetical protein V4599_03480 [Verrucomicrobiota bacterium]